MPHRFNAPEDVPPHLKRFLRKIDTTWYFDHPFGGDALPYPPGGAFDHPVEEELAANEDAAIAAIKDGNYEEAIGMVSLRHRGQVFLDEIAPRIPRDDTGDRLYWQLLRKTYRNATDTAHQRAAWTRLFTMPRSGAETFMKPKERAWLSQQADPVTLYRGVGARDATEARDFAIAGFSWTFNEDIAKWFAVRGANWQGRRSSFVATVKLAPRSIHACLACAREDEVLILPEALGEVEITCQPVLSSVDDPPASLATFARCACGEDDLHAAP